MKEEETNKLVDDIMECDPEHLAQVMSTIDASQLNALIKLLVKKKLISEQEFQKVAKKEEDRNLKELVKHIKREKEEEAKQAIDDTDYIG